MYKYVFLNSFGVLSPFMEAISLNRKKKVSSYCRSGLSFKSHLVYCKLTVG